MGSFETMHTCSCYGYLEDVNVNCADGKIIFDKITAFSTEIILRLALKRVASLCTQLLPGFSNNQGDF